MKTTYILGIITLAELFVNHHIGGSIPLWFFYGMYKLTISGN